MKYRLDHNTFLRTFENVTVLDNQANHVRKTVSGHDKAFVDRLTYNGFTEATAEEATLAERLHSLWMIVAEGEKDHDFTYTDKRKTEETKVCVGMPQSRGYSVWFIVPDTMWQYVPQMIKDEISINKKPNLINITEAKIQEAIDKIITERFGKQTLGFRP